MSNILWWSKRPSMMPLSSLMKYLPSSQILYPAVLHRQPRNTVNRALTSSPERLMPLRSKAGCQSCDRSNLNPESRFNYKRGGSKKWKNKSVARRKARTAWQQRPPCGQLRCLLPNGIPRLVNFFCYAKSSLILTHSSVLFNIIHESIHPFPLLRCGWPYDWGYFC